MHRREDEYITLDEGNGYGTRSRQSSSVGCVVWSVAYAPAVVVAANLTAASLLLASDRKTKQGNHRHNAATARSFEIPFALHFVLVIVSSNDVLFQ